MLPAHVNADLVLLVGRVLLSALFVQSAVAKSRAWNAALDELASFGLPRSPALLAPALAVQWAGGLGVALGLMTFWAAAALIGFLLPTTFLAHGFWRYGQAERPHHVTGFFQNLTMCGGLVLLLAAGPGRWSLDAAMQQWSLSA